MSATSRPVAQVVKPEPVIEGAGVHLRRSIGTQRLDHLDPFLLLDHFESVAPADYEAGFPYHPHRGIETVTIVRKGEVKHRDSLGHQGSIGADVIHWMSPAPIDPWWPSESRCFTSPVRMIVTVSIPRCGW